MECEVEYVPQLLGINVLYRVCQYLRGDVPLSYLRDWQVDMWLNRTMCNAAECCFLQRFEGLYHERGTLSEIRKAAGERDDSEDIFKQSLHKMIGGVSLDCGTTGSLGGAFSGVEARQESNLAHTKI
jgi:hypothetical protein